jgi:hypothetical protein
VEEIEFQIIYETRDQAIKNIIQMERMGPRDQGSVSDCTGVGILVNRNTLGV